MTAKHQVRRRLWRRVRRLPAAQSGQAMTEYVILTAVMTALAAWLYYPDNLIFQAIRNTYNKTQNVVSRMGP